VSTSDPQMTEEERAYLQDRIGLLGKSMLAVSVVGLFIHLASLLTERTADTWVFLIFLNPMIGAALWRACQRGAYRVRTLRAMSFAALFVSMLFSSVLGRLMLPSVLRDIAGGGAQTETSVLGLVATFMSMSILLGGVLMVALRAAIVPSSRARTIVVTILIGVPVVVVTSLGAPPFESPTPFMDSLGPEQVGSTLATGVIWWGLATFVCALITTIVHGLRREVREARRLGQYTLGRKLGEGGMGVVYQATHALLRRDTAIKLLSPEKAGEANLKRFEQEVQLTARLTHPNTITVFDYGHTPDGLFYYAMELLQGANLDEIVAVDGAMSTGRALDVLTALLGALEEAHGIGLIHRDIKPGNVLLCAQGGKPDVTKLVDFGLVKEVARDEASDLTNPNVLMGTPLYIAPEAVTSPETVGNRSDLYAVGAVGYFLLTGHHVFEAPTLMEVVGHHLHTTPTTPSEKKGVPVPDDVETLILACLAKSPEDRPQSARTLRTQLMQCADFGTWTEAEARAWWDTHAAAVEERKATASSTPGALTIQVAHGDR